MSRWIALGAAVALLGAPAWAQGVVEPPQAGDQEEDVGLGGAADEGVDDVPDRNIRRQPAVGEEPESERIHPEDSQFEPVPPPELTPPTDDPSIMGQEREGQGGAAFDTGDTSDRAPGLMEEGGEPGPAAPLPRTDD